VLVRSEQDVMKTHVLTTGTGPKEATFQINQ